MYFCLGDLGWIEFQSLLFDSMMNYDLAFKLRIRGKEGRTIVRRSRTSERCSCICGKETVHRVIIARTSIFLMPAKGLQRFGLARFQRFKTFLPDAVFRRAGRGRRRIPQARRDEQPQEQDYFFSRVQAARRLPEAGPEVTRRHCRYHCRVQRLKWKAARRPVAGEPVPRSPTAFGSAARR